VFELYSMVSNKFVNNCSVVKLVIIKAIEASRGFKFMAKLRYSSLVLYPLGFPIEFTT
jgi:hypothetical protein